MQTRRSLLLSSVFAVAAAGIGAAPAVAQGVFDTADLRKPGLLPDKAMGREDAPVTIVEYASMTCGHCAHFHETVFPHLKEKYIDTGKVYFIFREFPLDGVANTISELARCSPGDRYFDVVGAFYGKFDDWVNTIVWDGSAPVGLMGERKQKSPQEMLEGIFGFAKQAGFTRDTFNACLADQKLLDGLNAGRERAAKDYKVDGTPTFFLNGRKIVGIGTTAELDEALAPLLKN